MNIAILTGHFHPEIHPRAFRAYELAKEFTRLGNNVIVYSLARVENFDYDKFSKKEKIQIIHLNLYKRNTKTSLKTPARNKFTFAFHSLYRWVVNYFFSGNLFSYAFKISKRIKITPDCDLFISLSTPFMDLYGTALYRSRNNSCSKTVFIADSGDPFYYSQQTRRAIYFKWIEKWVYKKFNYVSIPIKAAIPAYEKILDRNKIVVIPQGFDIESVNLAPKVENSIVTFAFSGVFYVDIRNPEFLLEYLTTVKTDFLFKLYLRYEDPQITQILHNFKKILGNKLQIKYSVKREDLLYELSSCDFLIDLGNTTKTQSPSKLIDYGITKRPFYSFTEETFDKNIFETYLKKDYSFFKPIDISKYDIKKVAKQFLSLA